VTVVGGWAGFLLEKDSQKIVEELETAHNTEIAGYFFYKAAAEMVEDEKGRNVFEHLAAEELDHIKVISAIAESVKSGEGWLAYEDAVKRGEGEGLPIFSGENKLLDSFKANQSDLNAVMIGIESEEKAVEFYSALLNKAETPDEKVVLTNLLEMEKAHLKVLRWESESLNRDGFWCGQMEYSVEKEVE
jgi:rubrerythrin